MRTTQYASQYFIIFAIFSSLTANAASTSFQDPATASWGGWNRGDANSVYAHWEEFGDTDGLTNDFSPDVGEFGVVESRHITNNPGAFITSGGFGGNISSISDTGDFTTTTNPFYDHPSNNNGPVTVAFQIASQGTDLDIESVMLSDGMGGPLMAPNSFAVLFDNGNTIEHIFLWNLEFGFGGLNIYQFDYNALGPNFTLDAVSIDIALPIPAAIWLFGSTLLGFLGVDRSRALF
ncbi:MAG: hypothetical protein AAF304_05245 [Pseudomonadota bacterium]